MRKHNYDAIAKAWDKRHTQIGITYIELRDLLETVAIEQDERDEIFRLIDRLADAGVEDPREKSRGHVMFFMGFEFFEFGGSIFRAPIGAAILPAMESRCHATVVYDSEWSDWIADHDRIYRRENV